MPTIIPSISTVFSALLRADFTTQWRNRKSFVMLLLIPTIILVSLKPTIQKVGGDFALGMAITIGLTAIGLMGYTNSVARDRDRGVFQRLRVTPVPSWAIMASRLLVQMTIILAMTTLVFVVGSKVDGVTLSPAGYLFGYFAAVVSGAVYLGLGQIIVGLIKNPESVHSTTRLIYFIFIVIGFLARPELVGQQIADIIRWSPFGVVRQVLSASFSPASWNMASSEALGITVAYTVIFTFLGIRWFQWK